MGRLVRYPLLARPIRMLDDLQGYFTVLSAQIIGVERNLTDGICDVQTPGVSNPH